MKRKIINELERIEILAIIIKKFNNGGYTSGGIGEKVAEIQEVLDYIEDEQP